MNKTVTVILGLACLGVGCAKDKSLEEYQSEQRLQQIAKIQAVAGSYGGALTTADGTSMGQLALNLDVGTSVAAGLAAAANVTAGTPSIKGEIILITNQEWRATFSTGFYDPIGQEFYAEIPVSQKNGDQERIEIQGRIQNGVATGTLLARGYSDRGLIFNVSKGQSVGSSRSGLETPNPEPAQTWSARYTGELLDQNQQKQAGQLTLVLPHLTSEQGIFSLLSSKQVLDATLTVGGVSLFFQNAIWDLNRGTLTGNRAVQSGLEQSGMVLDCSTPSLGMSAETWACSYILNRVGVLYRGNLKKTNP